MTYATCSVCREQHRLTQPTGASPHPSVIVQHGSSGHPDWVESCPGSGQPALYSGSLVDDVDARGVTVVIRGRRTVVDWETLRAAASQEDQELAVQYTAILDVARRRAAEIRDRYGCRIVGIWYEWIDDDQEPCAALVADGLDRPRIPSRATVTRQADPDEVAAAWRAWRTGEDIRIYAAGLEPMPRRKEWWS